MTAGEAAQDRSASVAVESIVPNSTRREFYGNALTGAAGVVVVGASIAVAPDLRGVLGAGLGLLMLAIAVIDGRRFIIPNPLTAAAFALGIVHAGVAAPLTITEAIALAVGRGIVVALIFYGVAAIYERLRGRAGLGLGDVKLAGVAGVWLDWVTLPLAVEIAALAAISVYVVHSIMRGRPMRSTARLPFGLFFATAIWLGWLFEAALM
jgi:leader peptidase (prepilin peptidase) / N-methyltransferase